jgi:hypothetical protein
MNYHVHPAWNHSRVKLLPDEPELFHGRYISGEFPQPESADMRIGTALHALVLEAKPPLTPPADVLTSNGQRRGKAWEAWQAQHAGETVLLQSEAELVQRMAAGVRASHHAAWLLEADGPVEQEVYWTDVDTGLALRAKLDKLAAMSPGVAWVVDLKTTRDPVTPEAFARTCLRLGYHRQAAWYLDAAREWLDQNDGEDVTVEAFVFVAVRNCPPFDCRVHTLGHREIDLGRRMNRVALADLRRRLQCRDWRAVGADSLQTIVFPEWGFKQNQEVEYGDRYPGNENEFASGDEAGEAGTVAGCGA